MKEDIYAHTDIYTYLRVGKAAIIGSCNELGKHYQADGTCDLIKLIEFDLEGDGNRDLFLFEGDKLAYYFISLARKGWLLNLLIDSINMEFLTYDSFLTSIIEKFTLVKMGFMDAP